MTPVKLVYNVFNININISVYMAREDKRSFPIVDLRGVLILFSPLKLLSAEQEVTDKVQRINNRTLIFGKRNEAWGSVYACTLSTASLKPDEVCLF